MYPEFSLSSPSPMCHILPLKLQANGGLCPDQPLPIPHLLVSAGLHLCPAGPLRVGQCLSL